jgi:hypothetical protein
MRQTQSESSQSGSAAPVPSRATPYRPINTATLELLRHWQQKDATTDPVQLHAAEEDLAEFMKSVNDARTLSGEPAVYP